MCVGPTGDRQRTETERGREEAAKTIFRERKYFPKRSRPDRVNDPPPHPAEPRERDTKRSSTAWRGPKKHGERFARRGTAMRCSMIPAFSLGWPVALGGFEREFASCLPVQIEVVVLGDRANELASALTSTDAKHARTALTGLTSRPQLQQPSHLSYFGAGMTRFSRLFSSLRYWITVSFITLDKLLSDPFLMNTVRPTVW